MLKPKPKYQTVRTHYRRPYNPPSNSEPLYPEFTPKPGVGYKTYEKGKKKMAKMAKGGSWIKGAIKKPGALREQLGVKKGEKIPKAKLAAAAKKGGKLGQRARLAITLGKMNKK